MQRILNFIEFILLTIIKHKMKRLFAKENTIPLQEGSIQAVPSSPERSWPDPQKVTGGKEIPVKLRHIKTMGPLVRPALNSIGRAVDDTAKNPQNPITRVDKKFLQEFEDKARSYGVGVIGYTELPPELIFKKKGVLYTHAIVMLKEMDKEKIQLAPSLDTFKMVFQTYRDLGEIVLDLANYLREKGVSCQATPPLAGPVVYPPLAAKAGLGWHGRHGLLISPEFGARQRITAIFCSIENLPVSTENTHQWIEDFCKNCGNCIKTCPGKAIREKPVIHPSGLKTHIIRKDCLPIFTEEYGCSVCIKNCAFSHTPYEKIREKVLKK